MERLTVSVCGNIDQKAVKQRLRKLAQLIIRHSHTESVASGVASYGARAPPRFPTISFLVYFGVNLTASYPNVVYSLWDQPVQMSTTRSSFDQYCISHKTISHRAAAAPGPWVRRECPMTSLQLCPSSQQILATPLSVATVTRKRLNGRNICDQLLQQNVTLQCDNTGSQTRSIGRW